MMILRAGSGMSTPVMLTLKCSDENPIAYREQLDKHKQLVRGTFFALQLKISGLLLITSLLQQKLKVFKPKFEV